MKTNLLITCFLILFKIVIPQERLNPFTNGEPIGVVYTDFYTGINQGNNPSAFEVTRAYLGYQFEMSEHFSTKIQLDIGSPDDVSQYSLLRRFAYFKDAYLQYQKGKITVRFGIIPLHQFKLQEKIWAHRYIYKSVMDEHGLGSSADLGVSLIYEPDDFIEFDLTLMNGEGYSNLQTDFSYKAGFGLTLKPWKGLIIRWYADAIEKYEPLLTIVNFVGYQVDEKFIFGFEYDLKYNSGFEKRHNIEALSTYLTYIFSDQWQVFGRYDKVLSNIVDGEERPWNLSNDGSALIAGVQFKPIEKVKIAVDYQDWFPYASNLENSSFVYLNLEFRIW